jgi:hypothetical protein
MKPRIGFILLVTGVLLTHLLPSAGGAIPADGFELRGKIPSDAPAGGSWWIADEILSQADAAARPRLLLLGDANWNDYVVRTSVRLKSPAVGAEAGLVLQARDSNNYLVFSLIARRSGPFAVLRIETSEGRKLVGDQSPAGKANLAEWHELRAEVHGTQVSCFLDGKPAANFDFTGTPPAYNTHGQTWPHDPDKGRVGFITRGTAADFKQFRVERLTDFSRIVTPQQGRRDAAGMLLPRQSYAETMKAFTDWTLSSDEIVDKSKAPAPIRDLPPYLLSNFVGADDQLWNVGGEYAFNHALLITGSIQYAHYSGDDKYLTIAKNVADWHLKNRTPKDWKFPYAPPSVVSFKDDGTWKGEDWGLEVDKSAYMGLAYLKLYATTGDERYFAAAKDLAGSLRALQQPDGSWPFRINAQTGEVKHSYACSQLWHVWFFNRLADLTGDDADRQRAGRALKWLLDIPVKTNKWIGLYGDIPSGAESYDQWVALETAMYALEHRDQIPDALDIAQGILAWVQKNLVVKYGFHPDIPGVIEQSQYKIVLTHHQLRLAELYAKLYEATGDAGHKRNALQTANSVTWCTMSDGKIRQGFWYHAAACPLVLSFNEQFNRIMSCIPETAPRGENHLLQNSSDLKSIHYEPKSIAYETVTAGKETFIVRGRPFAVSAGGQALPQTDDWKAGSEGWSYADSGLLHIRHRAPKVTISFSD